MRTLLSLGGPTKEFIESVMTSSLSPERILEQLDRYGIEWYLTEQSDLMIKYWQVGAEDFLPVEHAARIREGRAVPREASELEWLSKHLGDLRVRYGGQWVAVVDNEVVAASGSLADLMQQVRDLDIDRPFVTEIPARPLIWATAYAG